MELRWVLRDKKKILQIKYWTRQPWQWQDVPIQEEEPPSDERQMKLFNGDNDAEN